MNTKFPRMNFEFIQFDNDDDDDDDDDNTDYCIVCDCSFSEAYGPCIYGMNVEGNHIFASEEEEEIEELE